MVDASSRGSLVRVQKDEMGTSCREVSGGEAWNSQLRVTLCAPSAPMSRVPLSVVPSVNVAVTPSSEVAMDRSFLLYYRTLTCQRVRGERRATTHTHVQPRPEKIQPCSSLQADGVRSRKLFHQIHSIAVIDRKHGALKVPIGRIHLNRVDESSQLGHQALFDARLGPVDAKVPVSRPSCRTRILFKHGCVNASLWIQSVPTEIPLRSEKPRLLEDLAEQQPSGALFDTVSNTRERTKGISMQHHTSANDQDSESFRRSCGTHLSSPRL